MNKLARGDLAFVAIILGAVAVGLLVSSSGWDTGLLTAIAILLAVGIPVTVGIMEGIDPVLVGEDSERSRAVEATSSRERGRPFKTAYGLTQRQPISRLEKKMARGMLEEGKEVWVTAFCDGDESLTVTANIGSWGKCEPADNVHQWPEKCRQLGASEVRWYHNHQYPQPASEHTASSEDLETCRMFEEYLRPHGIDFRSFVVFPTHTGGYRIQEFGVS